jgi:hypothetical protein
MRLGALFRLAFASAPALALTSPHIANSPAHSSKGTPSRLRAKARNDALTVCKRTVSGAISLPSRGTFHLSLTVLVHYRSLGSSQPYEVGLANSYGISRAPYYLGTPPRGRSVFDYRAITFFGRTFQTVRLTAGFVTPRPSRCWIKRAPRPPYGNATELLHHRGLG